MFFVRSDSLAQFGTIIKFQNYYRNTRILQWEHNNTIRLKLVLRSHKVLSSALILIILGIYLNVFSILASGGLRNISQRVNN